MDAQECNWFSSILLHARGPTAHNHQPVRSSSETKQMTGKNEQHTQNGCSLVPIPPFFRTKCFLSEKGVRVRIDKVLRTRVRKFVPDVAGAAAGERADPQPVLLRRQQVQRR